MHICQVTAEGAGLQCLHALSTFDIMCIPLGGGDLSPLKPLVGVSWELGSDATWGADRFVFSLTPSNRPGLYCVIAQFGVCFRRGPIPSLEVAEGLLDVSPCSSALMFLPTCAV